MARLLAIVFFSVFLTACTSIITPLITPKVQQDPAKLKAGQYSLDKAHASLLFKIQHLGLSTYVGRFNDFDASLEFDPNNISASKLRVLVEIDSLDINAPDLKNDLMGRSWFHQAAYPYAEFESTSIRSVDGNDFVFSGQLSWRGVTAPIDVTATFNGGANNILSGKYTLGFTANASFLRSDFGMDKFVPLVGDDVKVEAYVEFLKN